MLAALNDPDPEVAAKALGWLTEKELADPIVRERLQTFAQAPRMLELLHSQDWQVRRAAINALGSLGGESAQAYIPLFVDCLRSHYVRWEAVDALARMGKAVSAQEPFLAKLLQDKDEDVRRSALEVMVKMDAAGSVQAPLVTSFLQSKDKSVRRATLEVLAKMGAAASAQAPLVTNLLQDKDTHIRQAAVTVLGKMGAADNAQMSLITNLLLDEDVYVRRAALSSLGEMGAAANGQAPRIARLLQDKDMYVRRIAVLVLGKMGAAASAQVPFIANLLQDKETEVRKAAIESLGDMGTVASAQAPLVASLLLSEQDTFVRWIEVKALVKMSTTASEQAPLVVSFLQAKEAYIHQAAIEALGEMGAAASAQIPFIASLLQSQEAYLRQAALDALGDMGAAAAAQAPLVGSLLQDKDKDVRFAAVKALGKMGKAASAQAPFVANLFQDKEKEIRRAAVEALEDMGTVANAQLPLMTSLLQDKEEEVRRAAMLALLSLVEPSHQIIAVVLAAAEHDLANRADWLLLAHISGGGDPKADSLLRWIGRKQEEIPSRLTLDDARSTLQVFADFWSETKKYPNLRKNLAASIADVTLRAHHSWERSDLDLLVLHEHNLREPYAKDAEAISAVIASLDEWRTLRTIGWTLAAHACFWILLLFFYPRSPHVQAFFFWNPWVRRIIGFGYVGLLLTWIPLLRRRILAPFDRLLIAEAQLERFSAHTYFEGSEVLIPASGRREPLLRILPHLRGQIVLTGASGLGKSMFLKYLLAHAKRLTVYLSAERCKDGVIEAIQAKLEGYAKDATFLRSLIYSGALDIYIDGLNEVTADTRARIVQFVESNFHGNILLTTQPIEWTAPVTSSQYVLQPLSDEQITRFLESREPMLGDKARLRGQPYFLACQRFVAESLAPEQPVELRQANCEVLSNPMDLTVVAQMLAEELQPDLFHLRQQQYDLMARNYREVHLDDFPLNAFSEEAYAMRSEDRGGISEERFGRALLRMETAKMVVRHQWRGPDSKEQREWHFRHDKIQEFFIAQTFLGKDNPRASTHLNDPRFRGVYLLLALLLEPEQARALRDMLVEYAAETRDHSVSDDFVTLLKKRQGAKVARSKRSRGVA